MGVKLSDSIPGLVKHFREFSFVFSAPLPAWRNLFSASGIFCSWRYQPGCTLNFWLFLNSENNPALLYVGKGTEYRPFSDLRSVPEAGTLMRSCSLALWFLQVCVLAPWFAIFALQRRWSGDFVSRTQITFTVCLELTAAVGSSKYCAFPLQVKILLDLKRSSVLCIP